MALNPIRSDPSDFRELAGQGSGITREHRSPDERNFVERGADEM